MTGFFASKRPTRPASAEKVREQRLTEDQLGELVRDACKQLGWHFLWLRKTIHSSEGVLDLMLVPLNPYRVIRDVPAEFLDPRPIMHRELKGHDARGRLGKPTPAQEETVLYINAAGGNAALWTPADWFSGKILAELK